MTSYVYFVCELDGLYLYIVTIVPGLITGWFDRIVFYLLEESYKIFFQSHTVF